MVLLYCFISEGVLLKKTVLKLFTGKQQRSGLQDTPTHQSVFLEILRKFLWTPILQNICEQLLLSFLGWLFAEAALPRVLHKKSVRTNFRKFVRNIYLFKFNNRNTIKGPETPMIHICFRIEWLVWEILHMVSIIAQQTFTCSKSTIETLRKDMEYVQSYHSRHQNDCWSFLWK